MSGLVGRAAGAIGRFVVRNVTYLTLVGLGVVLSQYSLGYNHVIGAFLLATLLISNIKLWRGKAGAADVVSVLTFLPVILWMLVRGNADLMPYMAVNLFGLSAVLSAVRLWRRDPLVFREEDRVAENYFDTAARGLLALACIGMSFWWMPRPQYVTRPFLALLLFRLAAPLRRWAYPHLLRLAGFAPTDGQVRSKAEEARAGYTPWRAGLTTASAALTLVVGTQLVFTARHVDVSVPAPYILPEDLLNERKAALARYCAEPPGSLDPTALTELGLVLHNLGLLYEADLQEAKTVLERAMFLDPANAQARAWYGSTLVAGALYETRTVPRIALISTGLRELDRAVALAPEDPVVRLARLDVYLGVPSFIGTRRRAGREAEALLRLAQENPAAADPILPFIEFRAGDTFSLLGDEERARQHWRRAQELLPEGSEDHRRLAAQLRGELRPDSLHWAPRMARAGGHS